MWPLDRLLQRQGRRGAHRANHEYLRIGALCMERWSAGSLGFAPASRQLMASVGHAPLANLVQTMRSLYAADGPAAPVTVVVESAWMPVLLADTGGTIWSAAQVQTLLRHRFGLLYGDDDDFQTWEIRTDHRPGERYALGYGLPAGLKQALLDLGAELQITFVAIEPAMSWALRLLSHQNRQSMRAGWWAWTEQDRLALALLSKGRVIAFNPAAPPTDDALAIRRLIDAECARWGLAEAGLVVEVSTWDSAIGTKLPALTTSTSATTSRPWPIAS